MTSAKSGTGSAAVATLTTSASGDGTVTVKTAIVKHAGKTMAEPIAARTPNRRPRAVAVAPARSSPSTAGICASRDRSRVPHEAQTHAPVAATAPHRAHAIAPPVILQGGPEHEGTPRAGAP